MTVYFCVGYFEEHVLLHPQGLLFCTGETVKLPLELLRCWLHETQRVYGDRLLEDKDLEMLNKLQVDVTKKIFEVRKETWTV